MTATLKVVGIEQLVLSPARPRGFVPRPSATEKRRIAEHGVLEPLAVRRTGDNTFEILSRPSVWVAAGQVGIHELPVSVQEHLSDADAASIVADHYQSVSLNPIDQARDLEEQLDQLGGRCQHGAVTRLSHRLAMPRAQIAHALRLLELPLEIQDRIAAGELSSGHARPLVTVTDTRRQKQLARKIVAEGLSVRAAEQLAREHRCRAEARSAATPVAAPNADVQRLQQRVADLVGCPFEIRGNEAVFNFFGDYEVLDGLLSRIGYGEG